jgi:hypothetical protein
MKNFEIKNNNVTFTINSLDSDTDVEIIIETKDSDNSFFLSQHKLKELVKFLNEQIIG